MWILCSGRRGYVMYFNPQEVYAIGLHIDINNEAVVSFSGLIFQLGRRVYVMYFNPQEVYAIGLHIDINNEAVVSFSGLIF